VTARARLNDLRVEAATCRNCELWECGTQTVFGEGHPSADVMLVGEQPGDREDREGRPFVGPAGKVLDRALEVAGIDRRHTYVTNAVKHFRWEARGKRRLHKRPGAKHIRACRPWLDQEIAITKPKVIVCLGATAAQALLGANFRLTKHRGELFHPEGLPPVTATIHPSAILRAPDDQARRVETKGFVRDLRDAIKAIEPSARAAAR
jgi:uracil-DNA glycosylase family protein